MSDEKPTCVVRRNYLNPVRRYCETHDQMFDGECPGPVIATPEKWCPHSPEDLQECNRCEGVSSTGHSADDCDTVLGLRCELYAIEMTRTIQKSFAETPVSEDDGLGDPFPAMTKFRADLAARNACTHDTGSYVACKFCGHNMGASDPSPELRERLETIAGYHDPHGNEDVQWCRACGTCFPCVTRVELEAVLDEVGEPK